MTMLRSSRFVACLGLLASVFAQQPVDASATDVRPVLQQWLQHRAEPNQYEPYFVAYRNALLADCGDDAREALAGLDQAMEEWSGSTYQQSAEDAVVAEQAQQLRKHCEVLRGLALEHREAGRSTGPLLPYLLLLDKLAEGRDASICYLLFEAWVSAEARCEEAPAAAREARSRWLTLASPPAPPPEPRKGRKAAAPPSNPVAAYLREVRILGNEAFPEVVTISDALLRELVDKGEAVEPRAVARRLVPGLDARYELAMQKGEFDAVRDCLDKLLALTPEEQSPNVLLAMLGTAGASRDKQGGTPFERFEAWRGTVDAATAAASDARLRWLGVEAAGQTDLPGVLSRLQQGATFEFFRTDLPRVLASKVGEIERCQSQHDSLLGQAKQADEDADRHRKAAMDPEYRRFRYGEKAAACEKRAQQCREDAAKELTKKAQLESQLPALREQIQALEQLRLAFHLKRS